MEADEVGLREEPLLVHVRHAERRAGGVLGDVPAEQIHAEAVGDPGEGLADLPGADHSDRAAVHVPAEEPVQPEVEVPGAADRADDAAVDGHGQRPGEFGDRVGE